MQKRKDNLLQQTEPMSRTCSILSASLYRKDIRLKCVGTLTTDNSAFFCQTESLMFSSANVSTFSDDAKLSHDITQHDIA